MSKKLPFKIGADPEFSMRVMDKGLSAVDIITKLWKNDATNRDTERTISDKMGITIPRAGVFGWDGQMSTGEIRPEPNNDISIVINNIRKLFKAFSEKNSIITCSTKNDKNTIGGHIHLQLPELTDTTNPDKFTEKAHKILSAFYLPILAGENKTYLKTRIKSGGYGKLNDYRVDHRGTAYVYEFRSPSAEWLTTPKIAEATLSFLAVVWNEIAYHPASFKGLDFIFKNKQQGNILQELSISNYDLFNKILMKRVKEEIKKFELYEDFKDQIEFILKSEKILKDKEKVDYDIMTGWGFKEIVTPSKREMLSKKKTMQKIKGLDIEEYINYVTLPCNDDVNVNDFIIELKKKIIAFNWKLKNNYFFFGLRKGAKNFHALKVTIEKGIESIAPLMGFEQYKHQSDIIALNDTYTNMKHRFRDNFSKDNDVNKPLILVGIPYEKRINHQPKDIIEFLTMIHTFETKPVVEQVVALKELIDDQANPKGIMAKNNDENILPNSLLPRENNDNYERVIREEAIEREENEGLKNIELRCSRSPFDYYPPLKVQENEIINNN